jgi:hypothetical protein
MPEIGKFPVFVYVKVSVAEVKPLGVLGKAKIDGVSEAAR